MPCLADCEEMPSVRPVSMVASPFVYLAFYLIFIWLAKRAAASATSVRTLALRFALSLVPIAFVYNITHYYTLLVSQGVNFVRLISDPFGFGWNLFGTAGSFATPIVLDAGGVWHTQVGLILLGHIVGVYLAHVEALRNFPNARRAIVSQRPVERYEEQGAAQEPRSQQGTTVSSSDKSSFAGSKVRANSKSASEPQFPEIGAGVTALPVVVVTSSTNIISAPRERACIFIVVVSWEWSIENYGVFRFPYGMLELLFGSVIQTFRPISVALCQSVSPESTEPFPLRSSM